MATVVNDNLRTVIMRDLSVENFDPASFAVKMFQFVDRNDANLGLVFLDNIPNLTQGIDQVLDVVSAIQDDYLNRGTDNNTQSYDSINTIKNNANSFVKFLTKFRIQGENAPRISGKIAELNKISMYTNSDACLRMVDFVEDNKHQLLQNVKKLDKNFRPEKQTEKSLIDLLSTPLAGTNFKDFNLLDFFAKIIDIKAKNGDLVCSKIKSIFSKNINNSNKNIDEQYYNISL